MVQGKKTRWYPCRDSNPGTRFRKPLLYPPELQGRGNDEADYAITSEPHLPECSSPYSSWHGTES